MRTFLLLISALLKAEAQTQLHIKSAKAAFQAAETARVKNDHDKAADQFEQAIKIEPTYMEAYEGLIRVLLDSNRVVDAASVITRLLEIEPNKTSYRLTLAKILQQNGDANRALAQFSTVLKVEPQNADALFGFATTAKQLGLQDRASQAMETGKAKYPHDKRFQ